MEQIEVGTHVELRRDVERFPHFVAPAGRSGVVVENSVYVLRVLMDAPLAGAEEWDNEVVWSLVDEDPTGDVKEI